jgi:hypothetical protein
MYEEDKPPLDLHLKKEAKLDFYRHIIVGQLYINILNNVTLM